MGGMTELFLGPLITKLIEVIYEYSKDQFRWQKGMKRELEELQNIHPQIQAVVSAYSQVETKDPALNKWYWQLRDAIDEADNVLDEIEYMKLQKQDSKNKKIEKNTGKVRSLKRRFVKICKRACKYDPILKRLEVAVQKLSEISAKVTTFLHLLDNRRQEQQQQQLELRETRETGSLIKNVLLGRSKEMEFVSQWLRNPNQTQNTDTTDLYRNISVLSVVGHGGMGKTTLLQHVYKDATTFFDVQMWVCVSTNFNAKRVIKNILESLKNKRPDEETLESLQKSLQSEVASKKFLLVLDDIWEENEEKWKNVFAALQHGNLGSKISISTRIPLVASTFAKMIKNNETFQLKGMEKDDCLQLFNKHAFSGGENPGGKFRNIAEKMVEKLSRCPLAIKFIGDFLNTCVDETFWNNVLNTNMGNLKLEESSQNYLLPILKLSYTHLPSYLQNCFSFCSIFPQDYEFDKNDLVRMWIAVGFIQSSDISEETLENTGRRYFNILVQKSFFDEFLTDDYRVYYKMHDLLHELAQSVSIEECFRVVGDNLSIPQTIRHLSIDIPSLEVSKEMEKFKHLRSLLLSFTEVIGFDENAISQILKASENIRLLVIYAPYIDYSLPETIYRLIHLRYLKVNCMVLKLSRSISHLYHLQFVMSTHNFETDNISWEELRPNKNCHLIKDKLFIQNLNSVLLMEPQRSSCLRFLTIKNIDSLVSFTSETELWFLQHSSTLLQLKVENLQSLQSLPSLLSFSSLTYLKLEDIPLLKSLPDLPSFLKKLELNKFESLESLPSSLSAISSLQVIELENIPLLKSLPDLPSFLKKLEIQQFKSLESLPSSLSAISSLKNLHLFHIPLLKSLPDLPSSLKRLYLNQFKSLEYLPSSLSAISSLETLLLYDFQLLKSLPDLPSSLKKLDLGYLKSLQCLPSSFSAISSLEDLEVKSIPLLKSLPDLPSSLQKLDFYNLKSLESLPSSLSAISNSLETIKLNFIPLLKSLPDLPSSLKTLELSGCKSLESLPSSLTAISSLQTIKLDRIPLLKSLPDLPSSLENLILMSLESFNCQPCSLSPISSLKELSLHEIPLLKSLQDLPTSLEILELTNLENLDCLPSCLPPRLHQLWIINVPRLRELPDFPASLEYLYILSCQPQLMKRVESFRSSRRRRWRGEG